jgi:hypothetical protein
MFIPGSVKSSKWGWDVKVYPSRYGNTPTYNGTLLASNAGYFTGGCLAPNGLIYCLPTYIGAQYVTVIKPGKSNSKTGKWEPATIVNIPATGGAKNPLLPDQASTAASLQRRFGGKGILAPNGLIYFFGFNGQGYVVVKPQDNPNFDIAQFTEWKVVTYASVGLEPVTARSGYYSGFLHTDGKIYLLPNSYGFTGTSSPIARIEPRTSYESSDTVQKSAYWTPTSSNTTPYKYFPTSATFSSVNNFPKPGDIDGVQITVPPNTYIPNYDSTLGGIGPMPPIGDAISHPNGNVYVFGGGRNAYILKLKTDDTTWNSSNTTVGRPLFYTTNDLRVPNNINPNTHTGAGIQGSFMSGSIEKLRPGQNPTTAKIYLHYAGTWQNDASLPTTGYFQNAYTRTVVFDPVTETFENVGDQVTTIVTDEQPFNLKPGIRMANGHIFSISNPLFTDKNRYGQLIISGDTLIDENKMIGPTTRRSILSDRDVSTINNSCYSGIDPVCNQGSHALTGSALGKTFVTAPWGCFEITSVKGFYPGIRYFNYNDNLNSSFTSAPSTHTGVTIVSKNQVKLLGVDLVSSLPVGSKFTLSNTNSGNDGVYTITARSLSGSDTLITVSGTSLLPVFSTYIEGVNFTSATELVVNGFYPELNTTGVKIYISDSTLGNDDYYTNTSYLYFDPNTTLTYSTASFTTGVDATARLYYKDPVNDATAVFTYGQLVEFPDSETLRIWGVDLSNSMTDVDYVNISGSSISGNNGSKLRYNNGSIPPVYSSNYSEILFSPGTFTTSDIEADVTMSFQYAFNDSDIFDIPSDLSTLPTSLYNAYFNKPR